MGAGIDSKIVLICSSSGTAGERGDFKFFDGDSGSEKPVLMVSRSENGAENVRDGSKAVVFSVPRRFRIA
jgi:hypothetical protein